MMNWLLLILPTLLIGIMFLAVIKSKIDKRFGRRICRTFVGIFVIAYALNSKLILLNFLSLVLLFLLLVPKKSLFVKKMSEESNRLTGLILYLLMVMLTILLFPLWIAGCCLVNLSFADGFASFVGEKRKIRLPWNKKKTLEGSLTFLLVSFLGCFLVMKFLSPLSSDKIVLFTLTTSLIASFVESLSMGIDDNIRVPIITGVFLYLLTLIL